jgi:hypothetical protein
MVLLLNRPDAPPPGAVNCISTPDTGLLWESVTVTARAFPNAVLTVADCGVVPALAVMIDAVPGLFVSEKFTEVRPVAEAVTVYGPPAFVFAVKGADAIPEEFVATVIVAVLLLNVPDAPDPGAVNVTFTPVMGLWPESVTVTASGRNAFPTVADCGVVPAFAVISEAVPARLVSVNETVVSPDAAAVTVYGPPAFPFAVNGADAPPDAFVDTLI